MLLEAFCSLPSTYMLLSFYFHYSEWKDEGLICCNCQKSWWLTHWHTNRPIT